MQCNPRSPGIHIVGSWVIHSISLYREPRTGTQYTGNWASRVMLFMATTQKRPPFFEICAVVVSQPRDCS